MNNQFLLQVIHLNQASIEDMKAMLITYPYCSLFRTIALLKAKQELHPLEKDWLETASIYAPDRSYLFEIYQTGRPGTSETPLISRTKLKPISQRFLTENDTKQTPLPKTSFSSWTNPKTNYLETVEPPKHIPQMESPINKPKTKEKPLTDEQVAARLAAKSVAKDNEIISETLAKVFAQQGKKQHAIDIYLKLSLKFPEKRAYFADLIESLSV